MLGFTYEFFLLKRPAELIHWRTTVARFLLEEMILVSWSGRSLPLLNPYVYYRVHEHKPMDPYPESDAYSSPTRALAIYIFTTHYSAMLPSKPVLPYCHFHSFHYCYSDLNILCIYYILPSSTHVLHVRPTLSTQ
jgi:hypothetical protein